MLTAIILAATAGAATVYFARRSRKRPAGGAVVGLSAKTAYRTQSK